MKPKGKALAGVGIGTILAVLAATGQLADFAHDQLGFVRAEDVADIKSELRAVNAQLELLIAIYEEDRDAAAPSHHPTGGDSEGGRR